MPILSEPTLESAAYAPLPMTIIDPKLETCTPTVKKDQSAHSGTLVKGLKIKIKKRSLTTKDQSPTMTTPEIPVPTLPWYFSDEELKNTPSVRAGYPMEKEKRYRQEMSQFIQVRKS